MSKKRLFSYLGVFLLCLTVPAWAGDDYPEEEVTESLVAQIINPAVLAALTAGGQNDGTFAVSPDNRRVAYRVVDNGQEYVVIDGTADERHDAILKGIVFSPDGKRIAYVARDGGKCFVVVDGKKEKAYDAIHDGTLTFSPDGKRLAYCAKVDNNSFAVIDGREGRQYAAILKGTLLFSPDGRGVVYAVVKGDKHCVIIDGEEDRPYEGVLDGTLTFSPDGQRLAYAVKTGAGVMTVIDGQEGMEYDGLIRGSLCFSPDSQNVAYAVRANGRFFVVVNGEGQKPHQFIKAGSLTFSPDGKSLAYVAGEANRWFVVADGKEEKKYDAILELPRFSPDGKRVFYVARLGRKSMVVANGIEGKQYDEIAAGGPVFGQDGKLIAYGARAENKWFAVVNGVEESQFDSVAGLAVSPDGTRVAYTARDAASVFAVVAGRNKANYDGIIAGAKSAVVFDSSGEYHYLAVKGKSVLLVKAKPAVNEQLETAIAALRHIRLEQMTDMDKWNLVKTVDDAWAAIIIQGPKGLARVRRELEKLKASNEEDDFFKINASALLWRLGGLDEAEAIAGIWASTPLTAGYGYVFRTAFAAAETRDPRAAPMLRACLRDNKGRVTVEEHGLEIAWPSTQEFLWGAYGAQGLPVLAGLLENSTDPVEIQAAIIILTKTQYIDAFSQIRRFALDARPEIRRAAIIALGEFGHPRDYDTLVNGLRAKGSKDTVYYVKALAAYGDLRAAADLIPYLRSRDAAIRDETISALTVLLNAASFEALQEHGGSMNEKERERCKSIVDGVLKEMNMTWFGYLLKGSKKDEIISLYRAKANALRLGEHALKRDEFLAAVEEWKKSSSLSGSSCPWIDLRHILSAAGPDDIGALLDARALFYTRLSDECLIDVGKIDRMVQYLGRCRYRKIAGVADKVDAI